MTPRTTLPLAALLALAPLSQAAIPVHPNIVVIVADDLGHADIGAQGVSKDVRTPRIDSIAHNGTRFTNGYVTCPVCSPSRAGFLTGKYQERFGHEHNPLPNIENGVTFGLPLDQTTLANRLHDNGYATAMIGKWHEGHAPEFRPNKRGFDEFFGFLGGAHRYVKNADDTQGDNAIRRNDDPVGEKDYLTDALGREAVSFVTRHKDHPFFLYLAFNAVHTPQQAPPRYLNRFPDVKDESRRLMLAMLSAEDHAVGHVLDTLHDLKLDDNTLVVFFSDNGGPTGANASSNAPFRGFKGQLWEGGIREPFFIQWANHLPAGQVLDTPVITLDLTPTIFAAADLPLKDADQLDGKNLLPLLKDPKSAARPHDTLYWRFSPQWALRDGDYKLIHTPLGTQLFDLSKDVAEQHDLSKDHPDVVAKLQSKYDAWDKTLHAPLWPGKQEGRQGLDSPKQRAAADAANAIGDYLD